MPRCTVPASETSRISVQFSCFSPLGKLDKVNNYCQSWKWVASLVTTTVYSAQLKFMAIDWIGSWSSWISYGKWIKVKLLLCKMFQCINLLYHNFIGFYRNMGLLKNTKLSLDWTSGLDLWTKIFALKITFLLSNEISLPCRFTKCTWCHFSLRNKNDNIMHSWFSHDTL